MGVRKEACLDESASNGIELQEQKLQHYMDVLKGKAEKMADKDWKKAKQKNPLAQRPDPDELLKNALSALSYQPSTLACFGAEDLAHIAIPEMSLAAQLQAVYKAVSDAMEYFDPIRAPLKAVALAGESRDTR
jgi:hypothetical protein